MLDALRQMITTDVYDRRAFKAITDRDGEQIPDAAASLVGFVLARIYHQNLPFACNLIFVCH